MHSVDDPAPGRAAGAPRGLYVSNPPDRMTDDFGCLVPRPWSEVKREAGESAQFREQDIPAQPPLL